MRLARRSSARCMNGSGLTWQMSRGLPGREGRAQTLEPPNGMLVCELDEDVGRGYCEEL